MTWWLELGSWWNRHLACDQLVEQRRSLFYKTIPDSRFPIPCLTGKMPVLQNYSVIKKK
ncbi:hypothetical protein [Moorena sp. SIO3B2]|uniref:hypothetical protein n=1 Tax=Moorena sp. SIO3B2 TaxID=2607827 RepID=UPI0013C84928|nr:hypothetical protein [Moorena sp. SIO3B2]NEP36234.1 hypothetical protein [Moorena sp. SIO3B2]